MMIAKLLRNLSGTDSEVGLGGNWIPLAAWLLENRRHSIACGPRASSEHRASKEKKLEGQRGPVTTMPSPSPSESWRPKVHFLPDYNSCLWLIGKIQNSVKEII